MHDFLGEKQSEKVLRMRGKSPGAHSNYHKEKGEACQDLYLQARRLSNWGMWWMWHLPILQGQVPRWFTHPSGPCTYLQHQHQLHSCWSCRISHCLWLKNLYLGISWDSFTLSWMAWVTFTCIIPLVWVELCVTELSSSLGVLGTICLPAHLGWTYPL